jgi:hypothetical protein
VKLAYTKCHSRTNRRMRIETRLPPSVKGDCPPAFTKLTPDPQTCVNGLGTEFHKNPSNALHTYGRRHKVCTHSALFFFYSVKTASAAYSRLNYAVITTAQHATAWQKNGGFAVSLATQAHTCLSDTLRAACNAAQSHCTCSKYQTRVSASEANALQVQSRVLLAIDFTCLYKKRRARWCGGDPIQLRVLTSFECRPSWQEMPLLFQCYEASAFKTVMDITRSTVTNHSRPFPTII